MNGFILNGCARIETEWESEPVRRAIDRFYRDMGMVLTPLENGSKDAAGVIILQKVRMEEEQFLILVREQNRLVIEAADELGLIYALCHVSRQYLGILPFWFWNDQKFEKRNEIIIPFSDIGSSPKPVKYRGWFINDEVLISHWDGGKDRSYPWEMAFEALLRCGGNMVIPGTDLNSGLYASLAADMGLWITQHHAEPLGAEMFLRAYPDKTPSYKKHPDLFYGLWEEGVKRQKDRRVIWNLGFRGQGDTPFWENDPLYDTPEKRGGLIGSIMREQRELVKKYVENPVFCVNLYGEIMELYNQGFLELPEDVIMIWADNGYGKMVSRRQWNHNPRIPAFPDERLKGGRQGVYYHVSFYDLQAANVLTMLPNSMEFVGRELKVAYDSGIKDFWLVNCSNIKPHVYPLDFVASLWNGRGETAEEHLERYLSEYYLTEDSSPASPLKKMKQCFQEYFLATISYGQWEDEHAGEQFYNYVTRIFVHNWMKYGGTRPCVELEWCVPNADFSEQMGWFQTACGQGYRAFEALLKRCEELNGELWKDSLVLQVKLHAYCAGGAVVFVRGYEAYRNGNFMESFYLLGQAADLFEQADTAMKERGHDKWKGFYDNDCQTDIKETAYLLRTLMGYVRNMDDGPYFYQWQRTVIYPEKDRKILLLLNEENHLTNEQLYLEMRRLGCSN